ncbi:MAG: disulfide bond formation protein DsbC [Stutzerimonas stutzeri]|nr:MAG: disulfide bond formation protein DsbC [Stutzerimonas stutzeri]
MFGIDRLRRRIGRPSRNLFVLAALAGAPLVATAGVAGVAIAGDVGNPAKRVEALLKSRLPKTKVTSVDCKRVAGLCEVVAGANLFYVDQAARYLVIGRVYDMEKRQDLTAARLLELNPDMLVGGAARANAGLDGEGEGAEEAAQAIGQQVAPRKVVAPGSTAKLSLAGLPDDGAIVWGNRSASETVTIFTDFRCGYCRALVSVLETMDVKVIERPISILGSRPLANRVWCARDRVKAMHLAYAGEPVRSEAGCDTSGLDANERFANQHNLRGTPVIVRGDGAMLEGYRPKQFLESWLKGGKS